MLLISDILDFLKELSGTNKIDASSDIYLDVGLVGDDFHEMIEIYSKRYSVDMAGYLWYFHADEEGLSIGGLFFKPPYRQVDRIPVTPTMLLDFANKGKWDMLYPNHEIASRRYDLLINKIILTGIAMFIVLVLFNKYLK